MLLYIVQIRLECWSLLCFDKYPRPVVHGVCDFTPNSLVGYSHAEGRELRGGVCGGGGGASRGNLYERQILASKKQAVSFDISTLCLPSSSSSLLKVAAQRTMVTTVLCPGSFHSLLLLGTQPVLLFPTRCDSSMGIQVLKI